MYDDARALAAAPSERHSAVSVTGARPYLMRLTAR